MKQTRRYIPSPCAVPSALVSTPTEGVREISSAIHVVPSAEWSPDLIGQVAELLAEALVLDFQAHREPMANSPPGFGHN